MATNHIDKIRKNQGDAKKEQEAYDEYADDMRKHGQTPKPLKDLRR